MEQFLTQCIPAILVVVLQLASALKALIPLQDVRCILDFAMAPMLICLQEPRLL